MMLSKAIGATKECFILSKCSFAFAKDTLTQNLRLQDYNCKVSILRAAGSSERSRDHISPCIMLQSPTLMSHSLEVLPNQGTWSRPPQFSKHIFMWRKTILVILPPKCFSRLYVKFHTHTHIHTKDRSNRKVAAIFSLKKNSYFYLFWSILCQNGL